MTKDERFLLELYQAALKANDEEYAINLDMFIKKLGYKEVLAKEVLKGLRRANLVQVDEEGMVSLTARGVSVARSLLP